MSCNRFSGHRETRTYWWRRFLSNSRPASPREGWDLVTMSSRWSDKVPHTSPGWTGSARATETTDAVIKFTTHVKQGRTISSALGFTIRTLANHEKASTSVGPTITPYSSVKSIQGFHHGARSWPDAQCRPDGHRRHHLIVRWQDHRCCQISSCARSQSLLMQL